MVKQGLSDNPYQSAHHLQSNIPSDNICWTAFVSSMIIWYTEKPFQVIILLFHFYSCQETALPYYNKLISRHSIHYHRVSLKGSPVLRFMCTAFLKLIISYGQKIIFNLNHKYSILLSSTSVKQLPQKLLSYTKPVSTGNVPSISPLEFSFPFFHTFWKYLFTYKTALVWKYS